MKSWSKKNDDILLLRYSISVLHAVYGWGGKMRKRTEDSFNWKNLDDEDELPTFAQKRKKMYETVTQSAIRKPKAGRFIYCPLTLNPYPYQLDNGCGLVVDDYNFEDQIGMYYNIEPE